MKNCILLFCILFFAACNDHSEDFAKEFEMDDFESVSQLKGQKVNFEQVLNPFKLLVKGDYLIVSNNGGERLIHILDKSKLTYVASKGKSGPAPDEIENVWELDGGLNSSTFWGYSNLTKKFKEYSLIDSMPTAIQEVSQSGDWIQGMSVHWISPNKLISYMNYDEGKFAVFSTEGDRLESLSLWDKDKKVVADQVYMLSDLNQGPKAISPDRSFYVLGKLKFSQFEILNLKNNTSLVVDGPILKEGGYKIYADPNGPLKIQEENPVYGYGDVYVTDQHIFLLLIGKTLQEYKETGEMSRSILMFDFEGNPISHFQLDYPISALAVDEKSKKIFGVSDDQDPGIVVFDFE